MNETPQFSDLTHSLLPRSLDPALPKADGSPEITEREPYKLTAADQPGPPISPASAEDKPNPLLDIVEQGMDAGDEPVARKVPDPQRSTVGTLGPVIT